MGDDSPLDDERLTRWAETTRPRLVALWNDLDAARAARTRLEADEAFRRLRPQWQAFVFDHVMQLPRERLGVWLDELLGRYLTHEKLAMLAQSALIDQQTEETKRRTPKRRGRPRDKGSSFLDHLRAEYRTLQQALKPFGRHRENHFNPANKRRATGQRLVDSRRMCLASPIGQRVNRAGLFGAFFDSQLTPGEMAARLLHREYTQALSETGKTPVDIAGMRIAGGAKRRADLRKQLGKWRTLYNKLRTDR